MTERAPEHHARELYHEPERLKLTAAEQVTQFRARRHLKLAKRKLHRAVRKQPKLKDGDDASYNAKHIEAMRARVGVLEEQLP